MVVICTQVSESEILRADEDGKQDKTDAKKKRTLRPISTDEMLKRALIAHASVTRVAERLTSWQQARLSRISDTFFDR